MKLKFRRLRSGFLLEFRRLLDNPLVSRAFDSLEGRIHACRSCYDGSEEIGHYDNFHALMFWIVIISSRSVPFVSLDCSWRHDYSILFLVRISAMTRIVVICPVLVTTKYTKMRFFT